MYEVGVFIPTTAKTETDDSMPFATELSIYPNPATHVVNVVHGGVEINPKNIRLFDVLGRNCADKLSFADHGTELAIDVSAITSGVYMLEINHNTEIKVFRLVVQ
jgi:hypothetical protein